MTFIEQANQWYKMYSIQLMIIASTILGVYESLPKETQAIIPTSVLHTCVIVLLVLSGISRMIKQNSLSTPSPQTETQVIKEMIDALVPSQEKAEVDGVVQAVTQISSAVQAAEQAQPDAEKKA